MYTQCPHLVVYNCYSSQTLNIVISLQENSLEQYV